MNRAICKAIEDEATGITTSYWQAVGARFTLKGWLDVDFQGWTTKERAKAGLGPSIPSKSVQIPGDYYEAVKAYGASEAGQPCYEHLMSAILSQVLQEGQAFAGGIVIDLDAEEAEG